MDDLGEVTPDYMTISEATSGRRPLVNTEPSPDYEHINTAFTIESDEVATTSNGQVTPLSTAPPDTTSVVEISQDDNSVEHRVKQQGKKKELFYRMSMAHLAPKGVHWGEEINKASEMQDDWEINNRVLNNLRQFPMSMAEKLEIYNYLRGQQSEVTSPRFSMGFSNSMTLTPHHTTMARGQKAVSDMLYSDTFGTLGFWDKPIAKITALLGTNVASYFKFLRFLAVLNTWSAIIMFCFVAIPQIISNDVDSNEVQQGFFGSLSQTIFFYGAYSNSSLSKDTNDSLLPYDRPLAYFLTWCSIYILSVLFIVMIMFTTYRRSKQTFGDTSDGYSATLLMGWDYSVTNKEGCRLKASALATHFREKKLEDADQTRLSACDRCSLLMVRVVCSFLCIAIMGGSGYLIYFMANKSIDYVQLKPNSIKTFFKRYQLTMLVSGLNISIPPVLGLLLYFEKWQPRTAIKIQLTRTAVFYAASLMVFLISVYTMSIQCESPINNSNNTALRSQFLPITSLKYKANGDQDYCCWENEVGQQLFQVVILDFLVTVGAGFVSMAGRAFVIRRFDRFRDLGQAEINVAAQILDIVYGQALIWLGLYAAPFLALVGVIKQILQFYFFYIMGLYFCDPPTSIFRASRSGGFFRFVLLVALFGCMFPLTYMIVSLRPSESCGPFQTHNRIYKVLTETIGESPDWLKSIIFYVSTPAVVVPVIILLLLLVFYYRVKSSTQKKTAKRIRVQFKMKRQLEKNQLFSKNRIQRGTALEPRRYIQPKRQRQPEPAWGSNRVSLSPTHY